MAGTLKERKMTLPENRMKKQPGTFPEGVLVLA
jgi:hypothetical protein